MKKLFLLSVILLSCVFANAQQTTAVEKTKRGPYLTNRFFDNWFISAGYGVQVYMGENDSHDSFGRRFGSALDISLGKWITPSVGVRFQYSGLQALGCSYGKAPYSEAWEEGNYYEEKFRTLNLHGDFMWNISNAISGYKEERFWDLIPYVGFGWGKSWNKKEPDGVNEIVANFGLLNNLRITKWLDINLEAKLMMVNERFDKVVYGDKFEGLVAVTAGLTYKFPVRTFKRASDIAFVDNSAQYLGQINDLKDQLAKAQASRDAIAKELAAEKAKAPKVVKEIYPVVGDWAVFFNINKSNITEKEMVNLGYMAEVMKQVPDKKFILLASADKGTGSVDYNNKLKAKRANAVYEALTKKFGVNADQLVIKIAQPDEQPLSTPQTNRVVIIECE